MPINPAAPTPGPLHAFDAVAAGTTCVLVTFDATDAGEARRVTPWVANDLREALAWVHGG